MKTATKNRPRKKFWTIKLGCHDIRVSGRSYREARARARQGKGRIVGVYC